MISSSHKCMYIYIYICNLLPTTAQPTPKKHILCEHTSLKKNRLSTTQPTQNKIYSILFLFIYISSQKLATNYSELFMATKNTCFLWPKPSLFMGFFGGSWYQPNQRLHPKTFPPKGSVLHPTRRRAVLAHGRKRVVRGLQGHHVRQLGRPRMTEDPGMALIHL